MYSSQGRSKNVYLPNSLLKPWSDQFWVPVGLDDQGQVPLKPVIWQLKKGKCFLKVLTLSDFCILYCLLFEMQASDTAEFFIFNFKIPFVKTKNPVVVL